MTDTQIEQKKEKALTKKFLKDQFIAQDHSGKFPCLDCLTAYLDENSFTEMKKYKSCKQCRDCHNVDKKEKKQKRKMQSINSDPEEIRRKQLLDKKIREVVAEVMKKDE